LDILTIFWSGLLPFANAFPQEAVVEKDAAVAKIGACVVLRIVKAAVGREGLRRHFQQLWAAIVCPDWRIRGGSL